MTRPTRSRLGRAGRLLVAAMMVLGLLTLNPGVSSAVQFCNTTPIIGNPGSGSAPPPNPSNPYPSAIQVPLEGTITDVNVSLLGLTTTGDNNNPPEHWPSDLDVMVTAPNNTAVVLMSDAGDNNDVTQGPLSGVNLTLDDQAPNQLPGDTRLSSGTFRPNNDTDEGDQPDVWPNSPATNGGGSLLSAFNGINPNGTWNLYIIDDTAQGGGNFTGGWCVDITIGGPGTTTSTTTPVPPTTTTSTTTPVPPTTTTSTTTPVPPTTTTSTTTPVPPTTTTSTTTPVPPTTTTSTTTPVPPTTTTSTTTPVPPTTTTSTTTPVPPTTTTTGPTTTTTGPFPPGTCAGIAATIFGTSGPDTIIGTPGPDVILGGGGNDRILGRGGDDVICGEAGNDQVFGGEGNDRIFGQAHNDQLWGEAGNDTLDGGTGADLLIGGDGNDSLIGGTGGDQCRGDAGTDTAAGCEIITGLP